MLHLFGFALHSDPKLKPISPALSPEAETDDHNTL